MLIQIQLKKTKVERPVSRWVQLYRVSQECHPCCRQSCSTSVKFYWVNNEQTAIFKFCHQLFWSFLDLSYPCILWHYVCCLMIYLWNTVIILSQVFLQDVCIYIPLISPCCRKTQKKSPQHDATHTMHHCWHSVCLLVLAFQQKANKVFSNVFSFLIGILSNKLSKLISNSLWWCGEETRHQYLDTGICRMITCIYMQLSVSQNLVSYLHLPQVF